MGRPPTHGAPSFRFHAAEVAQMETILREHVGQVPPRELLVALATQFSNSPERQGKSIVQMKQVWNWFQNRRYALRSKLVKPSGNPNMPPNPQGEVAPVRNLPPFSQQTPIPSGHNVVRNISENPPMEFEAKSARDGAWYDVQAFLSHRYLETGNPEVLVRFAGFGQEEDEWVNVHKHVRQRSLPCESTECIVVLPGDLILCFQEGKEQALYFDAHVFDAQRRRHDVRGCRCRFLVRYDHDQSEEIVPLRKICRRPETDYRLQLLHSTNESASASSAPADLKKSAVDPASTSTLRTPNPSPFSSHTTTNPTAGVPHPIVSLATASTSASSSNSAPSLAPIAAPSSSRSLPSASTQALAQVPVPAPAPPSAKVPMQSPALAPALAPGEAPGLALAPPPSAAPTQAPAQAPALASSEAPASASASASSPAPALASASNPAPSLTLIPSLTPTMTSTPTLTPVSVQSSISVEALEVKKIESDRPAASLAGEVIVNPSAASIEVKMEDISIRGTSTDVADGSSVSQGETRENPSVATVLSPEKVESNITPSQPIELGTEPMEGGVGLSTVAERSNALSTSVDDTKEGNAGNG